jgi:hypothetical protein
VENNLFTATQTFVGAAGNYLASQVYTVRGCRTAEGIRGFVVGFECDDERLRDGKIPPTLEVEFPLRHWGITER